MERGETEVGGIYYSQLNPLHQISVTTDINDPLSLFNHVHPITFAYKDFTFCCS